MLAAVGIAGRHGMLTLIHCEDGALVRFAGQRLLAAGRGGLADWAQSRPVAAERAAVERAVAMCEATGSPVYIVHLSSRAALESARRARSRGLPVFVETRPLYLYLTSAALAGPQPGRYIGSPPLREPDDQAALWAGLADGSVHTVGSDHAPWSLRDKIDDALDVTTARQGVADLETIMPMLFSEGVRAGRISLARFVALTSANPARLFGLYPRKGTIAAGSDADLVVLDPSCAARSTAVPCTPTPTTRSTTAARSAGGRGSRSAAARSSSRTGRSWPRPAADSGCAAAPPRRPDARRRF